MPDIGIRCAPEQRIPRGDAEKNGEPQRTHRSSSAAHLFLRVLRVILSSGLWDVHSDLMKPVFIPRPGRAAPSRAREVAGPRIGVGLL